jgi:hypothetical protein
MKKSQSNSVNLSSIKSEGDIRFSLLIVRLVLTVLISSVYTQRQLRKSKLLIGKEKELEFMLALMSFKHLERALRNSGLDSKMLVNG